MADGDVPRILVGVHGSVSSLHALRFAVDETRLRGSVLYSVIAWSAPGGDMVDRRSPDPRLRRVWRTNALARLRSAWDDALGGIPDDVPVRLMAEQGQPGWVLTGLAGEDDLLVVGAGRDGAVRRATHRSVPRYCVARARCRVLVVPPPALARGLDHGVLPSVFRNRRIMHDLLHNH